jgi:polyhydroxyalkanoate synthase
MGQQSDHSNEPMRYVVDRVANWFETFVVNPADPPLGLTPKDVVWKRGKVQLYRYRQQADKISPVPYLIVPWLGISRAYVLDLLPGASLIEFLVQRGHDVYLLDWGEFAEEDRDFGFEEPVLKLLPRAIDVILETSDATEITLNGICLGGTVTSSYLALNPDAPVRNAVCIVSPIDFEHGGLFRNWLHSRFFPADLIVQRYGGMSPDLMGSGFKMLRPLLDVQAYSGLWSNLDKKEYVRFFKAMNRWSTDYIAMPGRFFLQLAKELYDKNALVAGEFVLGGRQIDLGRIRQPTLVAAAAKDDIVPPLCAKALIDVVDTTDKEYIELPGGHISVFAGRQASQTLWPRIDEWLSARSR